MDAVFRSSEIVIFNESSMMARGNGFSINYKSCTFIHSFFLLVDTILEIKQFFGLVETYYFKQSSFWLVES